MNEMQHTKFLNTMFLILLSMIMQCDGKKKQNETESVLGRHTGLQ